MNILSYYFYSHAREGRDNPRLFFMSHHFISTHTPARGVTKQAILHLIHKHHFYSHAREGRD